MILFFGLIHLLKTQSEGTNEELGSSRRAGYDTSIPYIVYENLKQKLVDLYGEDPESGWRRAK